MVIGERIRFFRNLRGMTQKHLGRLIGFSERTADIRMAQYENGTRTPKGKLVEALAYYLNVSPMAIDIPDVRVEYGIMHMLFVLEDQRGIKIREINNRLCVEFDPSNSLYSRLRDWHAEYEKFASGLITKEEYDQWRYTYPEIPVARQKADRIALRKAEAAKSQE